MPDDVGTIADPQRFMDTLVDRALGIFANEPIDIYVNSTYIPDQLNAQYDALWTPARMKKIVDGLAAQGIAMEINNRRRIPSAAFIRLAKEAGVKFACGTNNAGADDLGRNEYCAEVIRQHDLRAEHFWTPPADGAKAVQRRPLPPLTGRTRLRRARPDDRPAAAAADGGLDIAGAGELRTLRRFTHEAMATVFEVLAAHADARYAEQAAHAAFDLADRLERELSRFLPNSDVGRINRLAAGEATQVSPSTMDAS